MKKYNIVVIVINIIFLFFQIKYFISVCNNDPALLFKITFVLSMLVYFAAVYFYIKYNKREWDNYKIVQIIIVLLSMLVITLMSIEIDIPLSIFNYISYPIIILGAFAIYKTREKVNISFIIWAIFILLWASNLYQIGLIE